MGQPKHCRRQQGGGRSGCCPPPDGIGRVGIGGHSRPCANLGTAVPALLVSPADPIHADRELGRRLAIHLRRMASPQPPVIQALLADLIADDQAFLAPVRDLTGRAAFLPLIARLGTGAGQLERDALLQSLAPTYSTLVLDRLRVFLDGLLDLPEPSLLRDPGLEAVPPGASATLPPQPEGMPTPLPPSPRSRRVLRRLALVAISGMTALLTAGAVLVLRSGVLCGLSASLPFCVAVAPTGQGNGSTRSPDEAIRSGLQAARDLATAADLPSFERALQQLESDLLPLTTSNLAPALLPQREGLEAIVRTARERLRQEQGDRNSLDLAREARDLALRQSDPATTATVESAIRQLQAISSGSFSEADARSLLRDLEAARLRLQQGPAAVPTPDPQDPGTTAPPVTAPPAVPSQPGTGPTPSREGGGGGQRSEPLF